MKRGVLRDDTQVYNCVCCEYEACGTMLQGRSFFAFTLAVHL